MGMVPTSMCVCGHTKGYHDFLSLPGEVSVELCTIWGCGCAEYEVVAA